MGGTEGTFKIGRKMLPPEGSHICMDEEYTIFGNKKRENIPKRAENQTIISKRCENKHHKLLYKHMLFNYY
jgi:hypothetical protein